MKTLRSTHGHKFNDRLLCACGVSWHQNRHRPRPCTASPLDHMRAQNTDRGEALTALNKARAKNTTELRRARQEGKIH